MKKNIIIILIVFVVIAGAGLLVYKNLLPNNNLSSQCQVKEITFYYLDECSWCNKVKDEGTLDKIESLGIKINKINARTGPIKDNFSAVPTFVIEGKVYEGYKTFEDIKSLLGCSSDINQNLGTQNQIQPPVQTQKEFLGEPGEKVILENGEVKLGVAQFNDNKARFYNIEMPDQKIIHFFVVKDKNGIYRAAADACQVCYGERKGFRQEGNEIICNNCGNRYPIEKVATEKGGCNPGPINPNLEISNGEIIIKQADIEKVSDLF